MRRRPSLPNEAPQPSGRTHCPRARYSGGVLLAVLAAVTGCDPGAGGLLGNSFGRRGELPAWAVGEMVALTDRTRPRTSPVFDAERRAVSLRAAGNETVSFQVVVDAGEHAVEGVEVATSGLVGPDGARIKADHVSVFRAIGVEVQHYPAWYLRLASGDIAPATHYDALVPLTGDEAFSVPPGKRAVLWVDVSVPRSARPGAYAGVLTLKSRTHETWPVRIELAVWDFVLPDARPLAAVGGFAHPELFAPFLQRDGVPFAPARLDRSRPLVRRGLVLMRQLMTLAHRHRLDLFDKRIRPTLRRDALGQVHLDWDDYDAIVGPYLDGTAFADRVGVPCWPLPISTDWPEPDAYGGEASSDYAELLAAVAAACRRHFAADPDRAEKLFCWPVRGRIEHGGYARHVAVARAVRSAAPEVPILSRLPVTPPAPSRWRPPEGFAEFVDLAAPPAHWLDPTAARQADDGDALAGMWLSPGRPPYLPSLGVLAGPADVRAVPWFAMKYHCRGLFLPSVLNWDDDLPAAGTFARTRLFYPGTIVGREMVLPSVRLKRLRRGLQDLAYLRLLTHHERGEVARTVLDAMVRYAAQDATGDNYLDPRLAGWVTDVDAWCQARRLLAMEILDAMHHSDRSREKLLAQRIAWRTFDTATREVRVERIRSRVGPAAGDDGESNTDLLEMTLCVELYNEYSRNLTAQLTAKAWPEGWEAVTASAEVRPLPSGAHRMVTLRARGTHVPGTNDGKLKIPLALVTDRRRELTASVAFLVAGRVETAPTIDGKLDDWPLRVANAAGGFRLLGRRGERGDGLAERQTLAFVLHDRHNVYIGFRCEEPTPDALVARRDNQIVYEQLMATGEDLVEVILDPGGNADSVEDLLHLVVKANGIVRCERGVASRPPLGRVEPWAAGVSAAVHTGEDFWMVEMAIPRAAFGDEADAPFWGVNFTRFATPGAEASSWSGATRYFYDPRSLGTMWFPPSAYGVDGKHAAPGGTPLSGQ
ncbi:MAG: DUF4091 domain-containing protein [Phycisphaerae bacterium]|nr:DUF4091 domain-containing protein [Phycisphaerae bacterium]